MTARTTADWPVYATPPMPPSSLLLGGCINALEPNPPCPAVSATGASVDRTSNRDPWGYGCPIASGVSRRGARAQRICPRTRVSGGCISRARARRRRSRASLSRGRGRGRALWGLNPSRHSSGCHLPSLCVSYGRGTAVTMQCFPKPQVPVPVFTLLSFFLSLYLLYSRP